jgi:hypothetical protein
VQVTGENKEEAKSKAYGDDLAKLVITVAKHGLNKDNLSTKTAWQYS